MPDKSISQRTQLRVTRILERITYSLGNPPAPFCPPSLNTAKI